MCLAIPGEVVEIDGLEARAEFWDVEKTVRLDIVGDTVEEGDYVLNHAGFAIRRIPDDQVEETIEIYEAFLEGDEDEALDEIGAAGEELGIDRGSTPRPGPMGKPDPELDPMADVETGPDGSDAGTDRDAGDEPAGETETGPSSDAGSGGD